jgi:hypothetical protein
VLKVVEGGLEAALCRPDLPEAPQDRCLPSHIVDHAEERQALLQAVQRRIEPALIDVQLADVEEGESLPARQWQLTQPGQAPFQQPGGRVDVTKP